MASSLSSARHRVDSDDDALELCYARGWTDGLPVVPPTTGRVLRFVEASGREPDDVVCEYPSRSRVVSVEKVAINAVMAGCLPQYLPVVLGIVEAMGDPEFGLHAINATTGGSAVGFVVNGPVRRRLEMNCRGNVLGPGNRANSTIGRAVRLTQINAMGSVSGAGNEAAGGAGRPILDRATLGQPAKYCGYHIVENEEDYPSLRPLHVENGFEPDDDVVTVFASVGHTQYGVHGESSAQEVADSLAHYLGSSGRLGRWGQFCVLVIPPENADLFVRDGWSKADIRRAIFEGTTRTVADVKRAGHSLTGGIMDRRGADVEPGDEEETVAIARRPEDILIAIAGGPAGAFVQAFLPYGGMAARKIRTP